MDDDLLLAGTESLIVPAPVEDNFDDLGDALNDYMQQPTAATDDAPAVAEEEEEADTAGGVPTVPDGRFVTELTKKQAKAELDKKAYKAWKKAMKSLGMGGDSDDEGGAAEEGKKDKKEKKDKSDKKEKKDKSKKDDKKKKSKRDRDGDEDTFAAELEGLAGDDEALESAKRRRRDKVKSRMAKMDADGNLLDDGTDDMYTGVGLTSSSGAASRRGHGGQHQLAQAAKRLSKEERERINYSNSSIIVQKMAEARKSDSEALKKRASPNAAMAHPPIARLLIKDEVLNFCRKADNEVPLVRAGFLREIAFWILDANTNELAPLDLRNVAYELLLRYGFKGTMDATHPNRVVDREDLNAWTGIGKEELEGTTLGKAVNTSRQHTSETSQNRQRAVTLLQRLSKAFSNIEDDDVDSDDGRGKKGRGNEGPTAVRWPCDRDSSIATPYELIANATEVFQNRVVQVDPLDPESYLRVPPLRIKKTPIR